jgi:NADPH:quinone reductase-like Zn-dependent oxidoreductase
MPDWPDQLRLTGGHAVDVVFDGIGGSIGATSLVLLADGGRFSGYGMTSGTETTKVLGNGPSQDRILATSRQVRRAERTLRLLPGYSIDN